MDCSVAHNDDATPQPPLHLGDIMSARETAVHLPEDMFSPLERILLTANGNVQRILSAYHNRPVSVDIIRNDRRPSDSSDGDSVKVVFDRMVRLVVAGKVVCTATSTVTITSARARSLIDEHGVGIGQLFRHLNCLPLFTLHDVGRRRRTSESVDDAGFWRTYRLEGEGIVCELREEFEPEALLMMMM